MREKYQIGTMQRKVEGGGKLRARRIKGTEYASLVYLRIDIHKGSKMPSPTPPCVMLRVSLLLCGGVEKSLLWRRPYE